MCLLLLGKVLACKLSLLKLLSLCTQDVVNVPFVPGPYCMGTFCSINRAQFVTL